MNAKVLILAVTAAIITLPVPASQLLAGTPNASTPQPDAAPEVTGLGLLLQDPFLIDNMSYVAPARLSDIDPGRS